MAEGTPPYEREKAIPMEGSGYGTERLRPIQTPLDRNVQPGTPNAFVGPIEPPGAAPPLSADDLVRGQQQASGMYQLDPNYRPVAEPRNRPQLKQTGFLGSGQVATGQASGGDPLWAATLAAPTFQLDRSLDNIRQQKADIEKWMADATSQFKGRAADPYQKAYQDYVSAEHNKFFQDVADTYYNGDLSKAIQATYRDPELNRQFLNVNRSLGAIGDANKGGYDYYEKVDKAIRDGNAEVDPETQKLLEQGLNGEWAFNGQGPAHNAAQFDRLNDRLSMNKLFNEFYEKNVNNAGDKTEGWSVQKDPKTGRKFLVITSDKDYKEFVDSFVEQAMKDGPYRDKEEARRFVEARVPSEHALRINELALGTGGGAAANQKPRIGNFQVAIDNAVPKSAGHTGEGLMFPMVDKDNKPFTETMTFQGRGGNGKTIVPDHLFVDGNGTIFVVGPNPNSVETQTANAGRAAVLKTEADDLTKRIQEEQKGPLTSDTDATWKARLDELKKEREKKIVQANDLERQTTKTKESEAIRVDAGNEERIRLLFGDEQFNMVKENAEKFKNRGRTGSLKEGADAKPAAKTIAGF